MESHLQSELSERVAKFDMGAFMKMLEKRHEEIDVELLDMLLSLGDFHSFKETMLMSKSVGSRPLQFPASAQPQAGLRSLA